MMKNIAYIKIGALKNTYALVVPNIDHESGKQLIEEAKQRALLDMKDEHDPYYEPPTFIFEFENETLRIEESPHFVHLFIKNENYAFDTPTINVHGRN